MSCFDFLEVRVDVKDPPAGNPFSNAELTGEFGAEGRAAVTVNGFCDALDGSVYRIRFMPSRAGLYHYTITFQQGETWSRAMQGSSQPRRASGPGRAGRSAISLSLCAGRHTSALVLEWDDYLSVTGLG